MSDNKPITTDEQMRREFNQWADAGRGEEMEQHHISITQQTLALMGLKHGERVLDLGCGAGWATRLLAQLVAGGERPGQVVGLDVSDEMVRRARGASTQYDNILFVVGSAQQIPWEENFFDKVLSVESFYYYPDQDRALAELFAIIALAEVDGSWSRLKVCADHQCLWAFYDQSKNRSRSWCNMAVCGNRAKARRRRQKVAGTHPAH